jgi:hypothetical protein
VNIGSGKFRSRPQLTPSGDGTDIVDGAGTDSVGTPPSSSPLRGPSWGGKLRVSNDDKSSESDDLSGSSPTVS